MSDYTKCTMKKQEIVDTVISYLERVRFEYYQFQQKGKWQTEEELNRIEARLIQIECLAIDLGIIETGTI